MREITTQVLREARLAAKTVSISYGAEFEMIDASLAPHFRKILQAFCVEIVRSGIQYEGDLTASLRRTWQISLSGSTDGQNLALVINWPGQVLSPNAALQTGFADLLALGGKFGSKTNRKNDRDVINGQDTGLDTHTLTLSFPVSIRTPAAPKVKAQIQDQEHITAQPTTQMVG